METGAILPLFYLPPVEYFSRMMQNSGNILIEDSEHFVKQSYRNRCIIHSPNGMLNLVVPVVKGAKVHTLMRDVKISYDFNWQRLHWMSIQTCYRSSAYFEFYEDDLEIFYEKRWTYLFDYNEQLLKLMLKFLKLDVNYSYTGTYNAEYSDLADYRRSIHPKSKTSISQKSYYQVFEEKNGFLPNLSIADLIFNQGPQSKSYL